MSVRRKILQKALKRFSKSKAVKGKAMSTAQRRALTKAVKASALKKKAMVKNRIGKAVGNASSSMSSWSAKKKAAMQKLWNRNKK